MGRDVVVTGVKGTLIDDNSNSKTKRQDHLRVKAALKVMRKAHVQPSRADMERYVLMATPEKQSASFVFWGTWCAFFLLQFIFYDYHKRLILFYIF